MTGVIWWHGDVYVMDAEGEFVEIHHGGEHGDHA